MAQFDRLHVNQKSGTCFVQPLGTKKLPPSSLSLGQEIVLKKSLAIGTGRDSLLEVELHRKTPPVIVRLGSSSGIEFGPDGSIKVHKGSFLFSHSNSLQWMISSHDSGIRIEGSGTWMIECLSVGLKLILLEGEIILNNQVETQNLKSGDLVLISGSSNKGSKPIQIELPLLLGSSRLINLFDDPLRSMSRMVSAARVQALRLKKRYEAFVGDVTEEKKLQLWTLPSNQGEETVADN